MSDFRLGDIVETIKGAKFWGEIIALDNDGNSPGCTVLAVDPGFAGTKHVYPLKQLAHRAPSPSPAPGVVEALDIAKRIRENAGGTTAHIIAANDAHNFLERFASLVSRSPDARPIDDTVVEALEMARHELWEMGATESENNALWHVRRALASLSQPAKGEQS